jgi:DNA-binding GntR family transcriptional regulator
MSLSIERLSTAERVADALREELLSGAIAPGTPMRDVDLSARAGVSRTTVREALAALAREGLLTHSLHRGMEVVRLACADVRDIYVARRVIERVAAETLIAAPDGNLDELERALHDMTEATARRNRRQVVEADVAFHTALVAALGNRRLRAAIVGALMELRLVLSVTDRANDDLDDQLRQHRALLELFRERKPEAIAALEEHLLDSETMVCAAIEATDHQAGGLHDRPLASLREIGDEQSPPGSGVQSHRER